VNSTRPGPAKPAEKARLDRLPPKAANGRRNPARTQERILAAALAEFSEKGLAGARVDAIARQAGVNKRMLYHYFGYKNGLFGAVLGRKVDEREALLASSPEDPADTLAYWFAAACRDVDWIRLLEWEALQHGDEDLVHEERRRGGVEKALGNLRRRQANGLLNARLDPAQLLLSIMALTVYPLAFPQVTRLVTGRSAFEPAFQQERRQFLRQLADILRHQAGRDA
jgi:TetR/AcrR family transcriptional regulator